MSKESIRDIEKQQKKLRDELDKLERTRQRLVVSECPVKTYDWVEFGDAVGYVTKVLDSAKTSEHSDVEWRGEIQYVYPVHEKHTVWITRYKVIGRLEEFNYGDLVVYSPQYPGEDSVSFIVGTLTSDKYVYSQEDEEYDKANCELVMPAKVIDLIGC